MKSLLSLKFGRDALARFWTRLRGSQLSTKGIALSVALGLAVGLMPLYGAHGLLVLALCLPLRLDAAIAFASTMISNPVTLPFWIALELKLGSLLVGETTVTAAGLLAGEGWGEATFQLAVGALTLAAFVGVAGAALAFVLVSRLRRHEARPA